MASTAAASDSADMFLPLDESDRGGSAVPSAHPWRVLIVDDDDDVHVATELAMRDVAIDGRPLCFLHARSAAEALDVIAADSGIAAVLLDVVMETPDAGLRLVRRIRDELGRAALRIILRTGQPGYAPEIETLRDYDINDYRTKSELTRVRLYSSLAVAIRSYAQLSDLVRQRDEVVRLNASLQLSRAAERAESGRRLAAEVALRQVHESVEQCVEQRTHELSRAVAELDAFNRMVSHDLRGPLHGLAGLSGLIQNELDSGDPEKIRRWLSMMEKQTLHLADLVGELLTLARVSNGSLQRNPVSLNQVVQEALQRLALDGGGDRLSAVTVGTLPELPVDAGLMRQAFVNLLSNALKFTRDSVPPRIEVSAERQGDEWILAVRDNGVGFDPARQADLFKPFSRLHDAQFEGSGIGLTIAQRVVERHGGRIWAEGRPGAGATFRLALPVHA